MATYVEQMEERLVEEIMNDPRVKEVMIRQLLAELGYESSEALLALRQLEDQLPQDDTNGLKKRLGQN